MTTVVEVDRVSKSYGDQSVLRELSFSIEQGEIFCLLGPNGAGKTTTLEILEGFLVPDGGTVRVLGCDPRASGETLRRRVGVVLQESGFPKFFRVGEMIDTWRSYYDDPLPYDDILDLVGLRSDEAKLVRKLSGGQRRRLDFALAKVAEQLAVEFPGLDTADEIVEGHVDDVRSLLRRLELLDEPASQRAFASLRIQPPSLEQAYLSLVGRQPNPTEPTSR